ncbi:MAG: DapH/DapD/GlmU-related protein [Candidatus Marinimicrobia bacterium]|nr:DapH/DapD/GlmU-related protein [Candidatus Neomarinimicrobiota bacterium]
MLNRFLLLLQVLFSPVYWGQSLKRFRFFIHDNVLAIPRLSEVGSGTTISPSAAFAYPENISLGKNCLINHNNRIYAGPDTKIVLLDGVMVGPDVFMTSDHFSSSMSNPHKPHSGSAANIFIDKNVRIGAHSIILPGVSIGQNTAVGAGSVVTKDVPADVIVAGNPARVVKKLL